MEIRTTYIGKILKNDKFVKGIWCGYKPENAIIEDEKKILYPDKNKLLRRKGTEVTFPYIRIFEDSTKDEFEEIERKE